MAEIKSDTAKREEEILRFWQENKIFEKSLEKDSPKGEYVFYDGPPFATGLPHYGHILAGTIKDVILRYKTMRGYHVPRRWGWDCHGLPLENEIEKELGLESKKDIETLGVAKFNEAARSAVLRYADDWKRIVPRMGRWVDMERDYRTMDVSYTESVWWVFKTLYDKGLVYEGFKSMHLCPRCGTTLSNFEVAQGYRDIVDFAVTVKLPLKGPIGSTSSSHGAGEQTNLLVWTTTPWTLPGNMAAAVNREAVYVEVRIKNPRIPEQATPSGSDVLGNLVRGRQESGKEEILVLAKVRAASVLEGQAYEIVREFDGEELVGKSYTPPFDYFLDKDIEGKENAWKIYHAPYVSFEEGTGAVHLAPAFGAEDMELAKQEGIPLVHHVDREGKFTQEVKDFAGMPVKPKDTSEEENKHLSADVEIVKYLADKGLLFKKGKITHSYPLCWRCDTPLLNYAAESWFVKVSHVRDKLVLENKKIQWVPKEVGENRFGDWLLNARDWAVSRARYWGAPLPVWKNEKTGKVTVIGSIEELKKYTKCSGNRYLLMRHGKAESNIKSIINSEDLEKGGLIDEGEEQILAQIPKLRDEGIELVITSAFKRARQTAEIVQRELGLPDDALVFDERIRELRAGDFDGKPWRELHSAFSSIEARFTEHRGGAENYSDVKRRVMDFLFDLEKKYKDKTILIISHGLPIAMMHAGAEGLNVQGASVRYGRKEYAYDYAEFRALQFAPFPHNSDYELDLHRPYIDEIELADESRTRLARIPDVFDCWFESGSMPYGQWHYPFENRNVFEPAAGWFRQSRGYPADFIAEGLDQTRGWFYSLLVLGVALFEKLPYKSVIVNGLVLAEDGKKMSKRLKNYPEPMEVVGAYGADAMRYYLLSSSVVRAEDLSFSEKGVEQVMKKIVTRLVNVYTFYNLYANGESAHAESTHILDLWILARLSELIASVSITMDDYELERAARPISGFIDDLSTWYIRRSRERMKGKGEDRTAALSTTRYVLIEFAKVLAPFMPFVSEWLYQKVKDGKGKESVHLENWPEKVSSITYQVSGILQEMEEARRIVSLALEARMGTGIKVRQPLASLKIKMKNEKVKSDEQLVQLIKDEVNVKEVIFDNEIESEVLLDIEITKELEKEGGKRELIRYFQELRKETGLAPGDTAVLDVSGDAAAVNLVKEFEAEIKRASSLSAIQYVKDVKGREISIKDGALRAKLKKG